MANEKENCVIARFLDGSVIKGTTIDFFPTKDCFHLAESEADVHEIYLADLKAVFFVKDLLGNASYNKKRGFFARHNQGKKIMVEFNDGEVLFGYTLSYSHKGLGFFMFPGDPDCNNTKIFVVHSSTKNVKVRTLPSSYSAPPYSRS